MQKCIQYIPKKSQAKIGVTRELTRKLIPADGIFYEMRNNKN